MKRLLCLLLTAALTLLLVSCALPPLDGSGTQTGTPGDSDSFAGAAVAAEFLTRDGIVDLSKREYAHAECIADLAALQAAYPDLLLVETAGHSLDGRSIPLAILGNRQAKKQVIVSAGIHGREYLTPLLAMAQIEFYLTYYNTGSYEGIPYSTLFSECAFYILPMCNPDGIMLSQAGLDAISDPTLREQIQKIYEKDLADGYTSQTRIDSYLQYWKANAGGTDLNRNFDALWEQYGGAGRPCCVQYKGPRAASEPETRALVDLTQRLDNVQAVLCIHSQGEVLYWNCGQTGALAQATLDFTAAVSRRTGYEIKSEKNNDASYSDWCALEEGLIAITVETGIGLCPLDYEKFAPIWEDNFDLLPLTAHYFLEK
ncbi:MAG: peptidase M14 [Clostridia bacterium]|nr:peptidase M14 [Clostridia bacterium]